jgi:hypothetical protein
MKKGRIIGLILFIVVVIVSAVAAGAGGHGDVLGLPKNVQTVKGYVGGEKIGFLTDPDVVKILRDRYGLEIDYTKQGSIEMTDADVKSVDFLFPSSQTADAIFKEKHGSTFKSEKVFYSPIVLYSWDTIAKALETKNVVKSQGSYYTADMAALIALIESNTKWSGLGLDIYGNFKVISTDPNLSNSGTMYAALLADILNGGTVPDSAGITKITPQEKQIFANLGQMESSSADIFTKYLNLGMGQSPIIVGYENQMIEYSQSNPDQWAAAKSKVALIYPEPTVWSEHYLIALDAKGQALMDALMDKDIQRIAWEKHGFRTADMAGGAVASALGIQETINKVIPVPDSVGMAQLLAAIKN